jgi:hypothetical protein
LGCNKRTGMVATLGGTVPLGLAPDSTCCCHCCRFRGSRLPGNPFHVTRYMSEPHDSRNIASSILRLLLGLFRPHTQSPCTPATQFGVALWPTCNTKPAAARPLLPCAAASLESATEAAVAAARAAAAVVADSSLLGSLSTWGLICCAAASSCCCACSRPACFACFATSSCRCLSRAAALRCCSRCRCSGSTADCACWA